MDGQPKTAAILGDGRGTPCYYPGKHAALIGICGEGAWCAGAPMGGWESAGNASMRPLRVGEMLSRIWDLMRGNLAAYLKLAGPMVGAFVLMYGGMFWAMYGAGMFPPPPAGTKPDLSQIWFILVFSAIATPLMIVLYAIYEGTACSTTLAAMRGERMNFAEAYRNGLRRAGSLVWMMILKMLAAMLPWLIVAGCAGVIVAVLSVRGGSHTGAMFVLMPLLVLAYIAAIVWVVWIALHWSLGTPACMAEGLTGWQALKRSGQLSGGGKGRIFGVMFLVALIGMAAVMALEMVGLALLAFGAMGVMLSHPSVSYSPAGAIAHFALWIVPFGIILISAFCVVLALQYASYAVSLTVLYQDQRFRHEGSLALPLSS